MKKILGMALIMVLLSGCDKVLDENHPVSVANTFWTYALSDNDAEAHKLMVNSHKLDIGIQGITDNDKAILGNVEQQGGSYFVDTTLQLIRDDKTINIPMRTVVVSVDGKWKVDYWSTKQSVFDATLDTTMKWFALTLEDSNTYIDDILGAGDKDEAVKYAEERINQEFDRAKQAILKNYKAAMDKDK